MTEKDLKSEIKKYEEELFSADSIKSLLSSSSSYEEKKPVRIKDELAKRELLKNKDLEQDIKLRQLALKTLLWFLGLETIIIFLFSLLQATNWLSFKLEEWSFRLIIGATITHTYFMLRIAVEYLFPKNRS